MPNSNINRTLLRQRLQNVTRLVKSLHSISTMPRIITRTILRPLSRLLAGTRHHRRPIHRLRIHRLDATPSIMSLAKATLIRRGVSPATIIVRIRPIARIRPLTMRQRQRTVRRIHRRRKSSLFQRLMEPMIIQTTYSRSIRTRDTNVNTHRRVQTNLQYTMQQIQLRQTNLIPQTLHSQPMRLVNTRVRRPTSLHIRHYLWRHLHTRRINRRGV